MPLLLAQSAAAVSIELSTVVAMMSVVVAVLLALLSAMVGVGLRAARREIAQNDAAHRELKADIKTIETDVKQLLSGQARIEGLLEGVLGQRSSAASPAAPAEA